MDDQNNQDLIFTALDSAASTTRGRLPRRVLLSSLILILLAIIANLLTPGNLFVNIEQSIRHSFWPTSNPWVKIALPPAASDMHGYAVAKDDHTIYACLTDVADPVVNHLWSWQAQSGWHEHVAIPAGICTFTFNPVAPDTVVVRLSPATVADDQYFHWCNKAQFWQSRDGAQTWEQVVLHPEGLAKYVGSAPGPGSYMYCDLLSEGQSLYLHAWSPNQIFQNNQQMNPAHLIVRSNDGGTTWQSIGFSGITAMGLTYFAVQGTQIVLSGIAADPATDYTTFLATVLGNSIDDGKSWHIEQVKQPFNLVDLANGTQQLRLIGLTYDRTPSLTLHICWQDQQQRIHTLPHIPVTGASEQNTGIADYVGYTVQGNIIARGPLPSITLPANAYIKSNVMTGLTTQFWLYDIHSHDWQPLFPDNTVPLKTSAGWTMQVVRVTDRTHLYVGANEGDAIFRATIP